MTRITFWIKTFMVYLCPRCFKQYRAMKKRQDDEYRYERDKHPVREKHNVIEGWSSKKKDGIRYRSYNSYEEYVTHQKQKLEEKLKIKGGFTRKELLVYRLKFFRRFRFLPKFLPKSAIILCAGARQGTEVEVLRDLGYKNAYGIDLNPGPENPFVRHGDFMCLDNADSSVDMIYSNCIDHAFDLETFFQEHARVLKPDGYVLYDIGIQKSAAFEAVDWDSEEIVFLILLRYFESVRMVNTESHWKWVLLQGKRASVPVGGNDGG